MYISVCLSVHLSISTHSYTYTPLYIPTLSCVKWGVNPPSSLLGGIGQGLGSLAYEVAGGVKDFVSNTTGGDVKGGMKALVARPGIGGGILVQKVKNVFKEEEEKERHRRMHSLNDLTEQTHRGRTTYDFDPIQFKEIVGEGVSVKDATEVTVSTEEKGEESEEKKEEEKKEEEDLSEEEKEIAQVSQIKDVVQ